MVATSTVSSAAALIAALSLLAGVVGTLVGAFNALREYQLKSIAQRSQINAQQAASDVELARLFAELVPIANGRTTVFVPDPLLARLLEHDDFFVKALDSTSAMTLPVGEVTQAAAISSIGYLGSTYPALRAPANVALEGLSYVQSGRLEDARRAAVQLMGD